MKNVRPLSLAVIAVLIGIPFTVPSVGQEQSQPKSESPKTRTDAEVRVRAEALLKQMTSVEKAGQLGVLFMSGASPATLDRVRAGEIGSLLFEKDPQLINMIQHVAVEESRLRIPILFGLDVIHGFRTEFPVPIGMAASRDPAMVENAQAVAAEEARAAGVRWTYAPMVDIARDPRWGRIVEGPGEDPYLGSAMAAAQVRGFQGDSLGSPNHILACVKHFAGYGAAEGGRDYDGVDISDDQLWNVYFPPFKSAVGAGVGTVMSAYMDLNGVPATGNRWLLQDVLRDEWDFRGFVVSDADAVKSLSMHGYAADRADAAVRALAAGVDMEMALGNTAFGASVPKALKEGRITQGQLDQAVRRILEMKIRLGLFENPYVDESHADQVLQDPSHRDQSRRAAERSAVLLRNEGALLPLSATAIKKIAVIGPLADSRIDIAGSWTFANNPDENVTVVEGLRRVTSPGPEFGYAPGVQISRKIPSMLSSPKHAALWTEEQAKAEFAKAVNLAQNADLVIMVVGENQDMSGEQASRSSLSLPGDQEKLLEAVVATGKPVVLVLLNGRPLDISWAASHVPAILEAWYPGAEGGLAIADLLYGKAAPGGKLPFTWPRSVGQVPIFYAHNLTHAGGAQGKRYWDEESTPLFPFGYGLSYAKFSYSNLHLEQTEIDKSQSLAIFVDVQNSGNLAGDEVVQLYIHQKSGTSSRPVRELKGFQRVSFAPGEKRTIRFELTQHDLIYWSSATRSWVQDPAAFDVWVGGDSTAPLQSKFSVTP
jgi:beta-glucosidase